MCVKIIFSAGKSCRKQKAGFVNSPAMQPKSSVPKNGSYAAGWERSSPEL